MAKFCAECGVALAEDAEGSYCNEHASQVQIRCPYCSELILASAKKCKHCGEFLNKQTAEEIVYLPAAILEKLPSMVQSEVNKLGAEKAWQFAEEYQRRTKEVGFAYLCWFLLGWHYAYLRNWGMQVLFWISAGGLAIWWFVDLFRIPKLVDDYNKDVAIAVLRDLKAVGK